MLFRKCDVYQHFPLEWSMVGQRGLRSYEEEGLFSQASGFLHEDKSLRLCTIVPKSVINHVYLHMQCCVPSKGTS